MRALRGPAGLAITVAVGCSSPGQPVARAPGPSGPPVASSPDAGAARQEEILAGIQHAMNQLDEVAQQCWAVAAAQRLDVEGELVVRVDVDRPGSATVHVERTTLPTPVIQVCMTEVLTSFAWAPPLTGQSFQLPFRFRAPAQQHVIDRRYVRPVRQGQVAVSVLLDEANTGNAAASLFEIEVASGATTGFRRTDRTEVWYFLGPASFAMPGRSGQYDVSAGDVAHVPAGGGRGITAGADAARAIVFVVPGGIEGAARAGALPTPEVAPTAKLAGPRLVRADRAQVHGPAAIYLEAATTGSPQLSTSVLRLAAGAAVPEHVHPGETEMLYVLEGSGVMTVAGIELPVGPTSVIQIPKGTRHAFRADAAVRAVQLYTPAGPEQRFKSTKASP